MELYSTELKKVELSGLFKRASSYKYGANYLFLL